MVPSVNRDGFFRLTESRSSSDSDDLEPAAPSSRDAAGVLAGLLESGVGAGVFRYLHAVELQRLVGDRERKSS